MPAILIYNLHIYNLVDDLLYWFIDLVIIGESSTLEDVNVWFYNVLCLEKWEPMTFNKENDWFCIYNL